MTQSIQKAARLIADHWLAGDKLTDLPGDCRPRDDVSGAKIQAALQDCLGDVTVGWEIAATSRAGQQHIRVNGPLTGRLFASRIKHDSAQIPLNGNRMRVAECEFVFVMGEDLPPRDEPYNQEQVLAAVANLHPGLDCQPACFAR